MALLAPIPITPKIKSNGGNALHVRHCLFKLNANLNNCGVIVKKFFKNFYLNLASAKGKFTL